MKKTGIVFLAILALTALTTIPAHADLLNGNFETRGTQLVNGVTDAPSWTITDGSRATGIYNGSYLGVSARTGSNFLWGGAFNGNTATISQTITTTAGQAYDLEFWLANTNGNTTANNYWAVLWNGSFLASGTNAAAFSYQDKKFLVTGTGSDTLTFRFRNEPGAFGLDDVTLKASAVPIPPAIVLFASGLGSLVLFSRKRFAC